MRDDKRCVNPYRQRWAAWLQSQEADYWIHFRRFVRRLPRMTTTGIGPIDQEGGT
jgi:hypothetical protein